jgi:RNA polymerase sigma factor (sigma-70 family)
MTQPSSPDDKQATTSFHVRQAREGNRSSLEWLVKKFSPLLLAGARYRLGRVLGALYDPEDIVNDVWLVALPKLPGLADRDGRYTPVLLKFLSTTLLYRVNNLVEKHIRGKPCKESAAASAGDTTGADPVDRLADDRTGIVSRMLRREEVDVVSAALERLEAKDREIVILRGVEGQPYKEIEVLVGRDAKVLAVQYQRAIEKLRGKLLGSVFDEMESD